MPSREWETARRLASPESQDQTEFVRLLALPIDAHDRSGVVTRYNEMRALFGRLYPASAQRMHQRMVTPNDPLGDLAKLELARWHRNELLSLAQARGKELDRGAIDRGTTPLPPEPRRKKDPEPIIGGVPAPKRPDPIQVIPPTPTQVVPLPPPTKTTPRTPVVIDAPTAPKLTPTTLYVSIKDPTTPGWLERSLNGVAKIAGFALSALVAMVPAQTLERAAQAAWLVFQLRKLTPAQLVGLAGEMAAEAMAVWVLESKMGIPASKIFNLNTLAKNFPGLDLLAPNLPISVKTYGVLSKKAGEALSRQLMSKYKGDAMKLFDVNHVLHRRYQRKVASRLLAKRSELTKAGVWPSYLSGSKVTEDQVAKYVRDHGVMMVPANHVGIVHMTMGQTYFEQYKQNLLPELKAGLSDQQVAKEIQSLLHRRFISSGLMSTDYRALADVAQRLPSARDSVIGGRSKPWPSDWGEPPTWTRVKP